MSERRPNIVLLISHDLGCHIGPYGWATEQTPRLTRLATEGMCFERHFVSSPGCSQSRSSLVTGRWPHANGQFGLAHLGWTLHRDEVLLPAVLREHGYRTALYGIWHLHDWTLAAFDSVSADVSTRDTSPEGYAEIAGQRAAQWIADRGTAAEPFYLHVGFWETHRPFCGSPPGTEDAPPQEPPPPYRGPLPPFLPDTPECRHEVAELHQAVRLVDEAVDRVLTALDETGLAENTLVLFTADHGLPFPRAKGTLYDPGIQVALVARWPGCVPAGQRQTALTSNVDLMPTLLEAAGSALPSRVQGRSFLQLLRGEEAGDDSTAVFAEKTYHEHYDPIRAVRTGQWKYIRNLAARPRLVMPSDVYNSPTRRSMVDDEALWSPRPVEELYDVLADPSETINLAESSEHGATLHELRHRLAQWMRETEDPLLQGAIARDGVKGS